MTAISSCLPESKLRTKMTSNDASKYAVQTATQVITARCPTQDMCMPNWM